MDVKAGLDAVVAILAISYGLPPRQRFSPPLGIIAGALGLEGADVDADGPAAVAGKGDARGMGMTEEDRVGFDVGLGHVAARALVIHGAMREQAGAEDVLLEYPRVRDVDGLELLCRLLDVALEVLTQLGHDLVLGMGEAPDAILMVAVQDDVELTVFQEANATRYIGSNRFTNSGAAAHQGFDVYEVAEVNTLGAGSLAEVSHELEDGSPCDRVDVMTVRTADCREPLPFPRNVHVRK